MGRASAIWSLGLGILTGAGCAGPAASSEDGPVAVVQSADESASSCSGKDSTGTAAQADVGNPANAPPDQGISSTTVGAAPAASGSVPTTLGQGSAPPFAQGGAPPPASQGSSEPSLGTAPPAEQGAAPVVPGSLIPTQTQAGAPPAAEGQSCACNCQPAQGTAQGTTQQGTPAQQGAVPVGGVGFAPVPVGGAVCSAPVGCSCCTLPGSWLLGRFAGLPLCFRL